MEQNFGEGELPDFGEGELPDHAEPKWEERSGCHLLMRGEDAIGSWEQSYVVGEGWVWVAYEEEDGDGFNPYMLRPKEIFAVTAKLMELISLG